MAGYLYNPVQVASINGVRKGNGANPDTAATSADVSTLLLGASARFVPVANGVKLQVSVDNGTTWQDAQSFTAT